MDNLELSIDMAYFRIKWRERIRNLDLNNPRFDGLKKKITDESLSIGL